MDHFDRYLCAMKNNGPGSESQSGLPEPVSGGNVIEGNFYQQTALRRHRRATHRKTTGNEPIIVLWDEIDSLYHHESH